MIKWPARGFHAFRGRHFMFHHLSGFVSCWDWTMVAIALYTTLYLPLELTFVVVRYSGHETIEGLLDTICAIDVLVVFRTTYRDHGYDVSSARKVALRYARNLFALDLLSSVPFDKFARYSCQSRPSCDQLVVMLRLLRLLRIGRLARKVRHSTRRRTERDGYNTCSAASFHRDVILRFPPSPLLRSTTPPPPPPANSLLPACPQLRSQLAPVCAKSALPSAPVAPPTPTTRVDWAHLDARHPLDRADDVPIRPRRSLARPPLVRDRGQATRARHGQ